MAAADSADGRLAVLPAEGAGGDDGGPEAGIETAADEEAKPLPAFPMPLGIEKIRVDFRTGRLSQDLERSLVVTVRGTNPRIRTEMVPPGGTAPEETGLLKPGGPADGASSEETGLLEPGGPADGAAPVEIGSGLPGAPSGPGGPVDQ
ncbi:MAG: hypothetical protein F4014_07595 [Gemmatimonadetes bacterium]|nr:hypothetical protein [Gemmatimonadota bacterium]